MAAPTAPAPAPTPAPTAQPPGEPSHLLPTVTLLAEQPLASYTHRSQVSAPEHAAELVAPLLAGLDREACVAVSLDTKHRVLAVDTVSVGTAEHTFLAPREIYRTALLRGACALFLAHNHPSGDPAPSADDRAVTRRLSAAGTTLGIDLLDHLVIGGESWTSLARQGVV